MKRIISILLLVCANIILLTHAVVPHHHHNGIAVGMVQSEKELHHDTNHQGSHNHDNDPNAEDCLLNNVLSRFIPNDKQDNDFGADYHFIPLFALSDHLSTEFISQGQRIKHRPYVLLEHSLPDVSSNGLRAPPIC